MYNGLETVYLRYFPWKNYSKITIKLLTKTTFIFLASDLDLTNPEHSHRAGFHPRKLHIPRIIMISRLKLLIIYFLFLVAMTLTMTLETQSTKLFKSLYILSLNTQDVIIYDICPNLRMMSLTRRPNNHKHNEPFHWTDVA